MPTARRDADRNRAQILEAARALVDGGGGIGLNAVARAAEVGVATVYRHFSVVEELEEALVWSRFDELRALLDGAETSRLEGALRAHFVLLVEDPLFEKVTARAEPILAETRERRATLIAALAALVESAKKESAIRDDVDAQSVLLLLCGVAHAVRSSQLSAGAPQSEALLRVTFDGLRLVSA